MQKKIPVEKADPYEGLSFRSRALVLVTMTTGLLFSFDIIDQAKARQEEARSYAESTETEDSSILEDMTPVTWLRLGGFMAGTAGLVISISNDVGRNKE